MATTKHRISGGINNQAHVDSEETNSKGHYHEKATHQEAEATRGITGDCKTDAKAAL